VGPLEKSSARVAIEVQLLRRGDFFFLGTAPTRSGEKTDGRQTFFFLGARIPSQEVDARVWEAPRKSVLVYALFIWSVGKVNTRLFIWFFFLMFFFFAVLVTSFFGVGVAAAPRLRGLPKRVCVFFSFCRVTDSRRGLVNQAHHPVFISRYCVVIRMSFLCFF